MRKIPYIIDKTKILNIVVPFDESLKLNLAIDECIRKLNKYKRSKKQGKRAALNLSINLSDSRLSVNETKLKIKGSPIRGSGQTQKVPLSRF